VTQQRPAAFETDEDAYEFCEVTDLSFFFQPNRKVSMPKVDLPGIL